MRTGAEKSQRRSSSMSSTSIAIASRSASTLMFFKAESLISCAVPPIDSVSKLWAESSTWSRDSANSSSCVACRSTYTCGSMVGGGGDVRRKRERTSEGGRSERENERRQARVCV